MKSRKNKNPSYVDKKFEDMTPAEQEQYKKDRAARFTWEEGNIKVIGNCL